MESIPNNTRTPDAAVIYGSGGSQIVVEPHPTGMRIRFIAGTPAVRIPIVVTEPAAVRGLRALVDAIANAPTALRPDVRAFAERMEAKLRQYDPVRRDGWKTDGDALGILGAFRRATDKAIDRNTADDWADVANYAMILAHYAPPK